MKKWFSLVLVLVLMSCNAIRVTYDYERTTDFFNYTTYTYFSDIETGLSALDTKRLFKAMDIALQGKGMLFSEEPDFYINIESDFYHAPTNNTVGVGVGGTGRTIGGGVTIGIPVGPEKKKRKLIFNFVDTKKETLFWEAVSVDTYREDQTPEQKEKHIQEIVNKVLEKYPPLRAVK